MPGLLLFSVLAGLWLHRLGAELVRQPDPLRADLFVAALIQLWPFASTAAMHSVAIGAWFSLLLGFGLAGARANGSPHAFAATVQATSCYIGRA